VHSGSAKKSSGAKAQRTLPNEDVLAQGLPQGVYAHFFDKAPNANRFLLGKGRDSKFLPHSDAASGMDLWLQDESGEERLVNDSVYSAKFSPDGSKVAFTTSECVLHIEDLQGGKIAEYNGAYAPSWKPDGSTVIFSQVGEGQEPHRPGTRNLATLDVATGQVTTLTDGRFDDGRPEYLPSSDSVIFVSGSRTGLASFWQVPAEGGEPRQLTNVGLAEVTDKFVPTPYEKTTWSADQSWFLYDYKSGDQQETWGLEFNASGKLVQATKLADGINPRWQGGRTFVCDKHVDGTVQTIVANLP
jgi:WD40 repeat protein